MVATMVTRVKLVLTIFYLQQQTTHIIMKFKHGDKVKIIQRKPSNTTGSQNYNQPNGDVGIICYLIRNTGIGRFELKENKDGTGNYYGLHGDENYYFQDDDLELVDGSVLSEEPKKSLVGRYLKVLQNYANATNYEKGDYVKITFDNLEGRVTCNKNYSFGQGSYNWDESQVELMSEGFVPRTETKAVESSKIVDLVEEAERRYPIGCKAKCFVTSKFHEITKDVVFEGTSSGEIFSWIEGSVYHKHRENGNWAEVQLPEPVSEPVSEKWEPKVGDWVVITELDAEKLGYENSGNNSTEYRKNDVVQLTRKTSYGWTADRNYHWWYTSQDSRNGIVSVLFRKAEPHEIPKTEKPKTKPMNEYTAEEALTELKRRGFKKGVDYVYMSYDGRYHEYDICTVSYEPVIKCGGDYIDCGSGFLWSKENPTNLHRGPISEPITNPCREIVIPNIPKYDWFAPLAFQAGISYQAKHDDIPNYLDPASLLPKTKLPI